MSQASTERFQEQLQALVQEYLDQGYEVRTRPKRDELPEPLRGFELDAIATRGDEVVVFEIKSQPAAAGWAGLDRLAAAISSVPQGRLEVVMLGAPPAPAPSQAVVEEWAQAAVRLVGEEQVEAAILLVWSAVEGALLRLAEREELHLTSGSAESITEAYSLGLLSDGQYRLLRSTLQVRNALAHGRVPPSPLIDAAATIGRLAELAIWMAKERFQPVSRMVEWFLENYKDPAEGVPHDASEGGYQYYAGGPYDAAEELAEQFPEAPVPDIDEAAEVLLDYSNEWVRRDQY